jgi:hypothetical protein
LEVAVVHALLLVVALGAARAPAKLEPEEAAIEKAHVKMKSLDFEAALPLLKKALASPKIVGRTRANALIDLAIAQINLGDTEEARKDFAAAFDADPSVTLPRSASPKIVEMFNEASVRVRPPPPETRPEAKPEPKPEPKPEVAKPSPGPELIPETGTASATAAAKPAETKPVPVEAEAEASGGGKNAAAWALIASGVVVAGGGGGCLGYSWSKQGAYKAGTLSPADARTANTLATVGVVLAGVGGAALVAGVVVALIPKGSKAPAVALVPVRGGGTAVLSFRLP